MMIIDFIILIPHFPNEKNKQNKHDHLCIRFSFKKMLGLFSKKKKMFSPTYFIILSSFS